jgi:hypothetical protein
MDKTNLSYTTTDRVSKQPDKTKFGLGIVLSYWIA